MGRRGRPRKYPLPAPAPEDLVVDNIPDASPQSPTPHVELSVFDEMTFGGLLTEDLTSRAATTPTAKDCRLFEQSLTATRTHNIIETPRLGKKRRHNNNNTSTISILQFGTHELRPWYSAPFPAEYFEGPEPGHLYMCEYCLKYMRARVTFQRHVPKCRHRFPPGQEIYRKDGISVFEVNGRYCKEYCQRLCLLAKMFLDHKTLYYDTETFLFYILVEWKRLDNEEVEIPRTELYTWNFIGYFSKEKQSPSEYNLSCIMILPHHQRKGYGSFLIDFSYLLSRIEGKLGTPEKPLSDLGLVGYVRYWSSVVLDILLHFIERKECLSTQKIAEITGMAVNDVLATLEHLQAISWNGQEFELCPSCDIIKNYRIRKSMSLRVDPASLRWVPYNCIR